MNSVRYRNDAQLYNWFQTMNSKRFFHLYVCGEHDRETVEKYFKEIENYGIINYGN